MKRIEGRRIWMSVLGVLICGACVGLFRTAALGVDPFQSLMSGLNAVIPISFGTLYVIVNAVLLLFSLLLLGLGIMCFGSAMYMNANLGVSTYDAIALIVSEKQRKLPFRLCRILSDLLCVLGGCALFRGAGWSWRAITAAVGPAAVVTAFFMGPLISFFAGKLPNYRAQPRR